MNGERPGGRTHDDGGTETQRRPEPGWPLRLLLTLTLPRDRREEFLGDLLEDAQRRAERHGPHAAQRWMHIEVLRSSPSLLGARVRRAFAPAAVSYAAAKGPATFDAYFGGLRSKGPRRPLAVTLSIAVHAVVLAALAWASWSVDEVTPPPIVITQPRFLPRETAPAAASQQSGPKETPPKSRPRRVLPHPAKVMLPAPPKPAESTDTDPPTTTTAPGSGSCLPGASCTGEGPGGGGDPPVQNLEPRVAEKSCVSCPPPSLPPAYVHAGIDTAILLRLCVDATGHVSSVHVLRGIDDQVDSEISGAVKAWTMRPYRINDRPIPFCYNTRFVFTTQSR